MTNETMHGVNTAVGCDVTGCKYNRAGDYCTLAKIHVGKACDSQQCNLLRQLREQISPFAAKGGRFSFGEPSVCFVQNRL